MSKIEPKIKKMVRPDKKGRITLGHMADGVSSFAVTYEDERIILEPFIDVPAREMWLYANKSALAQVKQGLKECSEKQLL